MAANFFKPDPRPKENKNKRISTGAPIASPGYEMKQPGENGPYRGKGKSGKKSIAELAQRRIKGAN